MGRKWLFPVCLIALLVIGGGLLWHTGVLHRISNQDHLVALLRAGGWTGALLCIAVQFLQVVIAVIPGEVASLAAGYVFGSWRGFLYSAIGITLGSTFNFWFARAVGRPTLERLIGRDRLTRIDRALAAPGAGRRCSCCSCCRAYRRTSCATRRVSRAWAFSSSWYCRAWPARRPCSRAC